MLKFKVILWTLVIFACCGIANGKVLFFDDFERDAIGKEVSKWENMNLTLSDWEKGTDVTVAKDPQNPNNKVAKASGTCLYIPKVAGRDDWSDYVWDFDWMWDIDTYVGTAYRVMDDGKNLFHGSRRLGGKEVHIYKREGDTWTGQIAGGSYDSGVNIWYTHRLIMKGDKHQIYMKKRDDKTPFEQLKPVVELESGLFKKGSVGILGVISEGLEVGPATGYWDNVVVAEDPRDLVGFKFAVEHLGKLTTTWGQIKK